ncbi:hypothetical protein QP938_01455 [Porticoccaceae bacterium LTM1]|nr:hypothetical protein QP938_01455 [Porticoccaceae bacterium LTM1]
MFATVWKVVLSSFVLVIFCGAMSAHSASLSFLKNSVFSELNQEEVKSLKSFIRETLADAPDKKVTYWKSSGGEFNGKMIVKFSYMNSGAACRRATIRLDGEGFNPDQYYLELCEKDGGWVVMETPLTGLKSEDWDLMNEAGIQALKFSGEGQPFSWFNKKTGNSGVLVPGVLKVIDEKICRALSVSVTNKRGEMSNGVYFFCKSASGEWVRDPGGE